MLSNLLIGVVGGLIATLITVVFASFWRRVISPWFEEKVYQDARIEGMWTGSFPDDKFENEEIITFRRIGHAVTGTMITVAGHDKGRTYELAGSFRNLILTATFAAKDRTVLERGTITLMLTRNGEWLQGYISFYYDRVHRVHSVPYICHRKLAESPKQKPLPDKSPPLTAPKPIAPDSKPPEQNASANPTGA